MPPSTVHVRAVEEVPAFLDARRGPSEADLYRSDLTRPSSPMLAFCVPGSRGWRRARSICATQSSPGREHSGFSFRQIYVDCTALEGCTMARAGAVGASGSIDRGDRDARGGSAPVVERGAPDRQLAVIRPGRA